MSPPKVACHRGCWRVCLRWPPFKRFSLCLGYHCFPFDLFILVCSTYTQTPSHPSAATWHGSTILSRGGQAQSRLPRSKQQGTQRKKQQTNQQINKNTNQPTNKKSSAMFHGIKTLNGPFHDNGDAIKYKLDHVNNHVSSSRKGRSCMFLFHSFSFLAAP